MRTIVLFDNINANAPQTSDVISFEQRGEWMLQISNTGLNGIPKLIIEYSIDNGASIWTPIENNFLGEFFFYIDDDYIAIINDRIQGKFFRVRLETNGNTAGTVKVDFGYKTYP